MKTTRFPIADALIGPWDGLLALLKESGIQTGRLDVQLAIAKQQVVELNRLLEALGELQELLTDLAARVTALETADAAADTDSTEVTGTSTYELHVQGPDISISGTSYLLITDPVPVGPHTESVRLMFWWESGNSGVDAQWRLMNQTTGDTILSGAQAAPFARTQVIETGGAAVMPQPGDEVALEVCFSGAGSGGEIEFQGPVTWEVA